MKAITPERVLFAGLAIFLVAALFVVDDYGMNKDSQKNFGEGRMHLNYLLTGSVDRGLLQWQMHGAYVFIAADAAKRLLHDRFGLLDATTARHAILPVMTAAFLACLFFFARRRWSALHGLAAAGLLLSFPYYWGHTFNNLKDVPLLIFFSLSIMCFVEWTRARRAVYFWGFFVLLGLAIAVKTNAFLVVPLLLLWGLVRIRPPGRRAGVPRPPARSARLPRARSILKALGGVGVTVAVVLVLYAPAFWGVGDKMSFVEAWRGHVKEITFGAKSPFSLNPFVQALFRTPLLVLIFALAGLAAAVRRWRHDSLNSLLVLWLFVPLVISCLPRTLVYHDGMRHFMEFLVPLCLLAAIGIGECAGFVARRTRRRAEPLFAAAAAATIGVSLWGVVSTHPYQVTFFNALAGGLKGAQEKGIPDACDYWLNSYREAGRWIDRNAAPRARVIGMYVAGTLPYFHTELVKDAVRRPDLTALRYPSVPLREGRIAIPPNTYVILVPFEYLRPSRRAMEQSGQFRAVHTISRQGGEICTIYYKP